MHRATNDLTRRRTLIAAVLAAAAALVIWALVVDPEARRSPASEVAATGGGGTVSEPPLGDPELVGPTAEGAVPTPTDEVARAASEVAPADGPAAAGDAIGPGPAGLGAPELDARIVRNGAVELRIPRRRFEQAWGDVQAAATGTGGYVIGASRSGAGDSARRATITMRVPGERFEAALERLREVRGAKVGRLDVTSQDVTQEFVDTRSRLRHDRAVEGRLLALLAQAEGVSEVLAVQARLDMVQQQIEVARGRLQYLERLTEMGTIEVSIVTPSAGGSSDREERSELGEAFRDAASRFVENVAGAVVWIGGALPALILLSIAAVVARIAWRRRASRARTPADPA